MNSVPLCFIVSVFVLSKVTALRRKLTEANARAEGLASAAGAAASRHEEILGKIADAHKVFDGKAFFREIMCIYLFH